MTSRTMPLLAYYDARGLLIRIDANRPVDEVTVVTIEALEEAMPKRQAHYRQSRVIVTRGRRGVRSKAVGMSFDGQVANRTVD